MGQGEQRGSNKNLLELLKYVEIRMHTSNRQKMIKIKSVHFVSSQPATASSRISSSQASMSSEASP